MEVHSKSDKRAVYARVQTGLRRVESLRRKVVAGSKISRHDGVLENGFNDRMSRGYLRLLQTARSHKKSGQTKTSYAEARKVLEWRLRLFLNRRARLRSKAALFFRRKEAPAYSIVNNQSKTRRMN